MTNRDTRPGTAGPAATTTRAVYGGKKLDPTPPADHDGFVQARALGLAAARAKLAARRKKR